MPYNFQQPVPKDLKKGNKPKHIIFEFENPQALQKFRINARLDLVGAVAADGKSIEFDFTQHPHGDYLERLLGYYLKTGKSKKSEVTRACMAIVAGNYDLEAGAKFLLSHGVVDSETGYYKDGKAIRQEFLDEVNAIDISVIDKIFGENSKNETLRSIMQEYQQHRNKLIAANEAIFHVAAVAQPSAAADMAKLADTKDVKVADKSSGSATSSAVMDHKDIESGFKMRMQHVLRFAPKQILEEKVAHFSEIAMGAYRHEENVICQILDMFKMTEQAYLINHPELLAIDNALKKSTSIAELGQSNRFAILIFLQTVLRNTDDDPVLSHDKEKGVAAFRFRNEQMANWFASFLNYLEGSEWQRLVTWDSNSYVVTFSKSDLLRIVDYFKNFNLQQNSVQRVVAGHSSPAMPKFKDALAVDLTSAELKDVDVIAQKAAKVKGSNFLGVHLVNIGKYGVELYLKFKDYNDGMDFHVSQGMQGVFSFSDHGKDLTINAREWAKRAEHIRRRDSVIILGDSPLNDGKKAAAVVMVSAAASATAASVSSSQSLPAPKHK